MEVHTHGHVHEQKKWKEYVFQFVMLFLAVFLGTLAENRREHSIEHEKEREYIVSLIDDLKTDLDLSNGLISNIIIQVRKIDTLQKSFFSILRDDPKKDSFIAKCYDLSSSIVNFYPKFFDERTISQLLSSGNLRLIKMQGVADSIMDYHGKIKFVEIQKQLYVNSANTCIQSMYSIYDIAMLGTEFLNKNDSLANREFEGGKLSLLTYNPLELKKFIAQLEITKRAAISYMGYLAGLKIIAKNLNDFLKNKYKIAIG